MNMYDLDKLDNNLENLFNKQMLNAPKGFTNSVMCRVNEYEAAKQKGNQAIHHPIKSRAYPIGFSLVLASLMALFINITPLMSYLMRDISDILPYKQEVIGFDSLNNSIEYFTIKLDYAFNRPLSYLTKTINKEEFPHE